MGQNLQTGTMLVVEMTTKGEEEVAKMGQNQQTGTTQEEAVETEIKNRHGNRVETRLKVQIGAIQEVKEEMDQITTNTNEKNLKIDTKIRVRQLKQGK